MSVEHDTTSSVVEYRELDWAPGYRLGGDGSAWTRWKRMRTRAGGYAVLGPKWKQMSPDVGKRGHLRVTLYVNGVRIRRLLHRLILEEFIGPCPPGMEACHYPDPNPANCAVRNLRWDTRKNNFVDRDEHGNTARGERHGNAILTKEIVLALKAEHAAGASIRSLVEKYGYSKSNVGGIIRGTRWAHVE
jgi:HNH endonuclease